MRVLDPGVVVELLAGDLDPDFLGEEELAAPHLIGTEVAHVLRGLLHCHVLTKEQGNFAMEGFSSLTITRFPADWLRPRIWALRNNLSGYDATYVALAEKTNATALMTHRCPLGPRTWHRVQDPAVVGDRSAGRHGLPRKRIALRNAWWRPRSRGRRPPPSVRRTPSFKRGSHTRVHQVL